jgi:hypothetical protein
MQHHARLVVPFYFHDVQPGRVRADPSRAAPRQAAGEGASSGFTRRTPRPYGRPSDPWTRARPGRASPGSPAPISRVGLRPSRTTRLATWRSRPTVTRLRTQRLVRPIACREPHPALDAIDRDWPRLLPETVGLHRPWADHRRTGRAAGWSTDDAAKAVAGMALGALLTIALQTATAFVASAGRGYIAPLAGRWLRSWLPRSSLCSSGATGFRGRCRRSSQAPAEQMSSRCRPAASCT